MRIVGFEAESGLRLGVVDGDAVVDLQAVDPRVGHARKPPLWMRAGDVCEIEIEGVGVLRNPIADEIEARAAAE
jgi:acylpyruvate hydrolase